MRCPICSTTIDSGNICTHCDQDVFVYAKVKVVSQSLYNKGISFIKARDLTGASAALTKSIAFDKFNIHARNLLGLVYFEAGQLGSALRQWIISASYQQDDNLAQHYLNEVQSSGRSWERLNDAVHFYNQALVFLQQKSEDMAIIRLKKAVEINPKFIDAYNLLALCHMLLDENDKALAAVEKVLKLDVNNTKALSYYLVLRPNTARVKPEIPSVKMEAPKRDYTRSRSLVERKKKSIIPIIAGTAVFSCLVGIIVSGAVYYTFIFPPAMQAKDDEIEQLNTNMITMQKDMQQKYDDDISQKDTRITELLKDNVSLLKENDALTVEGRIQAKVQEFQFIQAEYLNGNVFEAVTLLYDFSTKDLPDDYIEAYDSLKAEAYVDASQKYYADGVKAFTARDYEEATPLFENCVKYGTVEKNVGNSLYHLGYVAELADDIVTARNYYTRVVDEFSDCSQFKNARNRLNKLPKDE